MKKTLKKLSKTILVIMLLIMTDISLISNCVQAAELTNAEVYEIDYCDKVLKYQGIARGAVYVVYKKGGVEYPAYCINPERIGVGETDAYNVNVKGYIRDVMLWRILINGYPYKTPGELGTANSKEAYLATKQAIYCYLENRDVTEYSGIGEAGKRTLNALKQIWYAAQKSTETKISNVVNIIPQSSEWQQDEQNSQYVSKTYKIEYPAPIVDYTIKIKGEDIHEDIIVTDLENDIKKSFSAYEGFKVLVPTSILNNKGSFEIELTTQMDTKPVLYGVSENENLQNYALTTYMFEDAKGSYIEEYEKNEAQIKILKRENETQKPLEGVEFQLMDSKEKVVQQSLITDENGEIVIENVNPGTYYLKEVKTLQGYVLYDENIKVDIKLNEQINIIVNNSKEKNIEISKKVTNIEVGKTQENIQEKTSENNINIETNETNIKKLPKTGK